MSELKTKRNDRRVEDFLNTVEDPVKREDGLMVLEMMHSITGEEAVMWGNSIVGFGKHQIMYASGRGEDWFLTGFSPRKQALTFYLSCDDDWKDSSLLAQLGKYKTGKACLYVKKLADVDLDVLRRLIEMTIERASQQPSA